MKDLIKAAEGWMKENEATCSELETGAGFADGKDAFIAGAKWQKKQSPWISVKDELPETSPVYGNASPYVLVFLKEYGFGAIGYYRTDGKWVAEFTKDGIHRERPVKVDFWMPTLNTERR